MVSINSGISLMPSLPQKAVVYTEINIYVCLLSVIHGMKGRALLTDRLRLDLVLQSNFHRLIL